MRARHDLMHTINHLFRTRHDLIHALNHFFRTRNHFTNDMNMNFLFDIRLFKISSKMEAAKHAEG